MGKDRPGIVESLAGIVKEHHGNWQTSSLRHMSDIFAGIVEIAVSDEHAEKMVAELTAIDNLNVQVEVSQPNERTDNVVTLDVTANDRPSIVAEISAIIHKNGGNLVKLVSTQVSAADSAQLLFKAHAKIAVENSEQVDVLVEALETISDDLMVDIET